MQQGDSQMSWIAQLRLLYRFPSLSKKTGFHATERLRGVVNTSFGLLCWCHTKLVYSTSPLIFFCLFQDLYQRRAQVQVEDFWRLKILSGFKMLEISSIDCKLSSRRPYWPRGCPAIGWNLDHFDLFARCVTVKSWIMTTKSGNNVSVRFQDIRYTSNMHILIVTPSLWDPGHSRH